MRNAIVSLDTEMISFRTFEEVEEWCLSNGGEDALRTQLSTGLVAFDSAAIARTWLERRREDAFQAQGAKEMELAERSTKAAERAADAASQSVRWSRWAAVIAVVALFLSAWPYMREWMQ